LAFLHARLPRVCCPEHGVRQVGVPWAREGSGFTLLFEALLRAPTRDHTPRGRLISLGGSETSVCVSHAGWSVPRSPLE
jgi:hypothetical protein